MTGVRVRRCEPPTVTSQTVAVVSDALLPILRWRNVPVFHETRQELTVLERFVLEMALTLGTITAEDFTEVVSLPRQVLAAGATRLLAGRALRLVGNAYHVEPTIAAQALQDQRIRRLVPATADFALLPRTGDLLAMPPGRKSWLRQLELVGVASTGNAPVPDGLWEQRRSRYLAARVKAGTAVLLDTDVVDVPIPDDDPPLVANNNSHVRMCPLFNVRAEVTRDERGQHTVHAVVHGKPRRRKDTSSTDKATDAVETAIQITGADQLVAEWLALAAAMADPSTQRAAWQEICPDAQQAQRNARQRGPVEWEFPLTGQAASAIAAQRRPLDHAIGLSLEDDKATVKLVAWLVPADDHARELFARDHVVGQLLVARDPVAALATTRDRVAGEFGVPPEQLVFQDVLDRAWDLKYYRLAYALREAEDFPYA